MANTFNAQEAIARAPRAEQKRMESVRDQAAAREGLSLVEVDYETALAKLETDFDDRRRDAASVDTKAYSAALRAGWNAKDLKDAGFDAPKKSGRTKRSTGPAKRSSATPKASTSAPQPTHEPDPQEVHDEAPHAAPEWSGESD